MKNSFATMSVLACVGVTQAAITSSLVDLGQVGSGTTAFDFVVTVTPDGDDADDWTVCGMTATLTGAATFVNNETYNPPCPSLGVGDPYDSYFACPALYPNDPNGVGAVTFIPTAAIEEPQLRFGEWYDLADTGAGTFVLHRLNVIGAPGAVMTVEGVLGHQNGGGNLIPYTLIVPVPEPASVALLALVGLALTRRR